MQLHCPHCGRLIPAPDVDVANGTAKCSTCNSVFSFSPRGDPSLGVRRPAGDTAALMPRPQTFSIEKGAASLVITWRWFNWTYVPITFFCIAWDAFLIFWYAMAIHGGRGSPLLAFIFPVGHVAVGVTLTYTTLAGFLNHTRVMVSRTQLTIAHRPLPWAGNRTLPTVQVTQLFVERTQSKVQNSASRMQYQVSAMMRDGSKIRLLGGFIEIGKAKFLEQEIEDFLHIAPRPVVGEAYT